MILNHKWQWEVSGFVETNNRTSSKKKKKTEQFQMNFIYLLQFMRLSIRLDSKESHVCVLCCVFSFSRGQLLLFMNSNCTFPTFSSLLSHQWIPQHCSWSHKYHFSVTFSLKLALTALFTYLKIILLQCFQFQQNKLYPNGPSVHSFFTVHMP